MCRRATRLSVLALAGARLVCAQAGPFHGIVERGFQASGCPGLSAAVSEGNRIVYSQAFGFADVERRIPLRTDSAHRLASLSKPVTGTIVMDMAQSGRLKLDEPVKTYLPDLPAAYDRVTVRHLLSHQAGIRAYRDLEEVLSMVHYPTSRDALRAFVNDPLLFEPGTRTAYSTFGFTLLGAVAEAVAGETFERLSADFFRRRHIHGFGVDDALADSSKRVQGYSVDQEGKAVRSRPYDASNKYPGGGFLASAEDYLRFVIAVGAGRVLKPAVLREMWTRQKTSDGEVSAFGLGWGVSQWEGRRMVGFNGLQPSTTTSFHYFPDEGVGIVLLCNAEVAGNAAGGANSRDLSALMTELQRAAPRPSK